MRDPVSVTELQSDAGGVKTRFVSCEATPDTRRKQTACEQRGGDGGEKINTNQPTLKTDVDMS